MVLSLLRHATMSQRDVTHVLSLRKGHQSVRGHLCRRYPSELLRKSFSDRPILVRYLLFDIYYQYSIIERASTINIIYIYRRTVNV